MLLHRTLRSEGRIATVEGIRDPIKMFGGIGKYFCSLISLHCDSETPAFFSRFQHPCFPAQEREWITTVPACPSPTNLPNLFLKSPVRQYLQLPTQGMAWGWGRGSSFALLLPGPSLCWETGNGTSQLASKVPASNCLPGPRFPQLNDACL